MTLRNWAAWSLVKSREGDRNQFVNETDDITIIIQPGPSLPLDDVASVRIGEYAQARGSVVALIPQFFSRSGGAPACRPLLERATAQLLGPPGVLIDGVVEAGVGGSPPCGAVGRKARSATCEADVWPLLDSENRKPLWDRNPRTRDECFPAL